eukprot:TRINITY_DN33403_c0_g1_i1.p1 TRINITY_DN33403_c0_g1~~TRINITY_DN33403_c0_g1_i1.p1  ORF type:complete len:510 (+),score=101.76 TRINITY_DN33403_c0_g1_i1:40-1530(+)
MGSGSPARGSHTVFFICLGVLGPCKGDVLGVPPEEVPRYQVSFACHDGSRVVSAAVINDDFCDCLDGSDEPGTAACAGLPGRHFFCRNGLSAPRYIFSSRVRDGICDCCDGSDEQGGCPNSCREEGEALRHAREARLSSVRKGLQLADAAEKEAAEAVARWRQEQLDNDEKLRELEVNLATARSLLDPAAAASSGTQLLGSHEPTQRRRGQLSDPAARRPQSHAEATQPVVSEYAKWAAGFDTPQDGAAAVAAAAPVELPADTEAATKSDKLNCWQLGLTEEYCCNKSGGARGVAGCWDETYTYEACCPAASEASRLDTADGDESAKPRSPEDLEKLRQNVQEMERELRKTKGKRFSLNGKLKHTDEARDLRWYSLLDACVEKRIYGNNVKICYLGTATHGGASMGSFDRWDHSESEFPSLRFAHGTKCMSGVVRSLKVRLVCGGDEEIISFAEPSSCSFEATVTNPVACGKADLERAEIAARMTAAAPPHEHDEL